MKATKDTKKITRRKFVKQTAKATAAITFASGVSINSYISKFGYCNVDAKYDVIIKNGIIYDGTLTEPYQADIGINKNNISFIGTFNEAEEHLAHKIIDASGLIITPGFIDVHTHCDQTFQRAGMKRYLAHIIPSFKGNYNYLYQGVSTVITGNCGWGYTDTDAWLKMVDNVGFGTNVSHLVPHGKIRLDLFGDDQPRTLSRKQLDALKNKVIEEMEKGASGLSSGLEYVPGLLSPTEELIELNHIVKQYDGIYATHIRDYSAKLRQNGIPGIIDAINEAIDIGRKTGVSIELSHLILRKPTNNITCQTISDVIEQARMEGIDLHADQFPYLSACTVLSFRLPDEFRVRAGIKEKYKTREGRLLVKKAIKQEFEYFPPDKMIIAVYEDDESLEGKTIQQIAEQEGKSPADVYVELVSRDTIPWAIFFPQDEQFFLDLMPKEFIITASDGYTIPKNMRHPHPQVYGTFPRKIRKFILNEKRLSLQAAIRAMTSLPAEKFHIKNRGRIALGYCADIAVINLSTIQDRSTLMNPHQYSKGIIHLFVNGVHSIKNGNTTGDRGGRGLRRSGAGEGMT